MRIFLISALSAALMTVGTVVSAHQFEFGLDQQIRVESNMFGSSDSPVTDGVYVVMPVFQLSGMLGDLESGNYRLVYRPSYLAYFDPPTSPELGDVDGFNTQAQADLNFRLSGRDTVNASASYTKYKSVQSTSQINPDGSFDVLADPRGNTVRAFVNLGYSRRVNPRSAFNLAIDFQDYAYDDPRNVGNKSMGATTSYTYGLSPRFTLGGSLAVRYRIFDAQEAISSSKVTVSNLNVLASYVFSESVELVFQGGPSIIYSQPGTVLGGQAPASETDLTYFMNISLSRELQRSLFFLRYSRNEDATGGANGSSILDSVSAAASFDLNEFWDIEADLGWSRRQSVNTFLYLDPVSGSPLPFVQEDSLHRVWGRIAFVRHLGEKMSLRGGFRYQRLADYEVDGISQPERDNYIGSVDLSYRFDSYVF